MLRAYWGRCGEQARGRAQTLHTVVQKPFTLGCRQKAYRAQTEQRLR